MQRMAWGAGVMVAVLVACGPERTMPWPDASGDTSAHDAPSETDTGTRCASNTDCDDALACTTDLCLIGGVCQHDSTCASGQFCGASGCSATRSCTSNTDCDDSVACTHDVCGVGGNCQNVRDDSLCDTGSMQTCSVALGCIAAGRCGADADCDDARYCNGAERCVMSAGAGTCTAGTAIACDDSDACTADQCDESSRMCMHTALNPCGGTVQSGHYTLSPAPSFTCANGSIGPVSSIVLTATASSVTLTGFASTLTGGAPSGAMFSASGPWAAAGCSGTITMSGSFTSPGMFMGSWNLSAGGCDISCNSHFALVNGTLIP